MAKRFTDTEKWKKPFIRALQAPYKLLWFYILDDCNHAGIWQVDMDVACLRIGDNSLSAEKAIELFGAKIQVFDNQEKWFIPDFIEFQYGILNPENRAHQSVISILERYGLEGVNKGLISPLEGRKDKDKDKDKEKVKEDRGVGKGPTLFKTVYGDSKEKFNTDLKKYSNGKYENYDPEHYFSRLMNWSESGGKLKKNWVATCANWIEEDIKKGTAILKKAEKKDIAQW